MESAIFSTKKYINAIKLSIKKEQKNKFIQRHKARINLSPYHISSTNATLIDNWYFSYGSFTHPEWIKNPREYLVTIVLRTKKRDEYKFIFTGNTIGIAINSSLIYASNQITAEDYFHISLKHDLIFSYDEINEIKKSLKGIKNKAYRIYFVPFVHVPNYNEYKLNEYYTHC